MPKDVDGAVTKYLYDGSHCIAEYDGSNVLLRKYIHGCCTDEPICMIETTGSYADTYYYHYDALGSVVALSDTDGDTVQIYDYDVYGQVVASDTDHPNPFLFTGRRYDTETGLYYYRARYYNPSIGCFLQTDPVGYEAGMNLYRYCRNNPGGYIDPSGRDPEVPMTGYFYSPGWGGWSGLTGTWNQLGMARHLRTSPGSVLVGTAADGLPIYVNLGTDGWSGPILGDLQGGHCELPYVPDFLEDIDLKDFGNEDGLAGDTVADEPTGEGTPSELYPETALGTAWYYASGAFSEGGVALAGMANTLLGGLFDESSGLLYQSFETVEAWSDTDAFNSGQTGFRVAVGATVGAVGVMGAESAGWISQIPQGNNYFRLLVRKGIKFGIRIDKPHHGKWIHWHIWRF